MSHHQAVVLNGTSGIDGPTSLSTQPAPTRADSDERTPLTMPGTDTSQAGADATPLRRGADAAIVPYGARDAPSAREATLRANGGLAPSISRRTRNVCRGGLRRVQCAHLLQIRRHAPLGLTTDRTARGYVVDAGRTSSAEGAMGEVFGALDERAACSTMLRPGRPPSDGSSYGVTGPALHSDRADRRAASTDGPVSAPESQENRSCPPARSSRPYRRRAWAAVVALLVLAACAQTPTSTEADEALSSPECQAYTSERDACLARLTGAEQTSASTSPTSPYGLVLQLGDHPSREVLDNRCMLARKQLRRTCR